MKKVVGILTFCFSVQAQVFVVPPGGYVASRIQLNHKKRKSSYPYITGDSFRDICDFVIDEARVPFDTEKLQPGQSIFLNSNYLDFFFMHVHQCITVPYVLVTHNSIVTISEKYSRYLDDEKLLVWFAQNVGINHHKLVSIPVGCANAYWPHGNMQIIEQVMSTYVSKDILLYVNFTIHTNKKVREPIYNIFAQKSFCYKSVKKPFWLYIQDLARSKFILSPQGNGIDCHRTWEALYVGSIPIVPSTTINELYKDLPVIIVEDWSIITKEFLQKKYNKMKNAKYNTEKLYMDYWIERIKSYRMD